MTTLHDTAVRGFASDNYSGVHPEILAAIAAANDGHQIAYGEDAYTARLQEVFAHHFGAGAQAFPVFNGTGANVTGLQSMLPRWGAVIAASTAHINVDEGGAPERVAGIKILNVPTDDGKLTPDEIRALADHAHERGMRLHLDGARLSNAAAALDLPLRAFTTDVGVDVLSFGGTKNGALGGEAVVVLDPAASDGLLFLRKLNMQLASKMRFISAQLIALLEPTSDPAGELYLRSARHANAMAQRLRAGVEAGLADGSIAGVAFTQPTQSNGVFATLPDGVAERLRAAFRFYDWDASRNEVRWMCSFDTTEADVDAFVAELARLT